ncbi:MAG: HD-GYP domain-containing protein [Betaproteobacteria bacterium]|nr:HD-GYP domain-containing protein [Betaproteobacteria bacterium]
MLKRIDAIHLKPGMFLHELCGLWIEHPFWRNRFLISDPEDIVRIHESPVREVWIDTERGLDVDEGKAVEVAKVLPPPPPPPPQKKASMREEVDRAAKICARAHDSVVSMFQEARLGRAVEAGDAMPLVQEISASVMRNSGALISLARLKVADDYTYMHSVAVCALMIALARQLNLSEEETQAAGLAGLMHDVGKMRIPPEILNKPGKLTDPEFEIIKTHPTEGHKMLTASQTLGAATLDVCLHHHEKVDGSGYPGSFPAEKISLFARMGAVCDVYDAVTSNRPYKSGWDPAESLHRMSEWKGHFDMPIFHAFVRSLGIYPIGSLVRLSSGRIGVVAEQSPKSLLTPKVKIFFSVKSNARIPPETIDLARPNCPERIVAREDADQWNFPDLNNLWNTPE